MSGFLSPDPRLRELSDLGVVQAGCLLHTYVSGTPSTPITTYSDAALTIPNANPIVASAGGLFGPIYLTPGTAYKYVLTDALGNVLWSQDPVSAPLASLSVAALTNHGVALGTATEALASTSAGTAGQVLTSNGAAADPTFQLSGGAGVQDFRLTLETLVPVSTTDQTAKTTLYASPYSGIRIALASAAGVVTVLSSAEFSIAVPATTATVYDVFAYSNAGVPTLELLAWTNATTRATALVRTTTGFLTKSGDLTRRFLGSFRTTSVSGQTEDSEANRLVSNYYNRVPRTIGVTESTDTWTYNANAWHQVRAAATNQVTAVVCWQEIPVQLKALLTCFGSASDDNNSTGIGVNSTSVPSGLFGTTSSVSIPATLTAEYVGFPGVGYHTFVWLERNGSTNSSTYYGDNGSAAGSGMQSGLKGLIWG